MFVICNFFLVTMPYNFVKFRKEKGISLLLTVFLLSLMLSISLGIFDIIYSELILSGDIRSSFFALYAADEIVEKTVYLDRISRQVCKTLSTDCWVTALAAASNNACNSVKVTKNSGTGFTEILGLGQYPGGTPCDTTSPLLTKRSFFFKYPMIETEDLAGWWRFDNESTQTVFDWTANNNDGVLGISSSVELDDPIRQNTIPQVVYGGALQFSDIVPPDRVTFPNSTSININWPISITAWVCDKSPYSAVSPYNTILKKGDSAIDETYALYLNQPSTGDAILFFEFKDVVGTAYSASSPAAVSQNIWTHIAVTFDGSQVRFYKNGSIIGPLVDLGQSLTPGAGSLRIGTDAGDPLRNFNGILDEVKIFNKTIQDSDVLREYNSLLPQAGNLAC